MSGVKAGGDPGRKRMRALVLAVIVALLLVFSSCSGNKAEEIFETAKLEELQKNHAHAKQLYREIVEKYPGSELAGKASERLKALE
jgi:TolA-binding protein